MHIHLPTCALTLALLAAPLTQAQEGAALDRLPEETVGAVVLPDAGKWADTMAKTTRLGQFLNDSKRWEPVWAAMEKADKKGELKKLKAEMARLNLKSEDIAAVLKHDCGLAILMVKSPGHQPVPMLVAWSGCGQVLADKLKAAMLDPKVIALDKLKTVRTDLNARLTRLRRGTFEKTAPSAQPDGPTVSPVAPSDEDEDADANGYAPTQADAGDNQAVPIDSEHEEIRVVGHQSPRDVFVASSAGYVLICVPLADAKDEADLARIEKAVTPAVRAFVEAQAKPGQGAFSNRLKKSPGVRAVMANDPGTVPLAQVLLDVPTIVQAAKSAYLAEKPDQAATADKLIQGLGLDGAGPMAFALLSDPGHFKSRMGWDCPAPRRGLLRLLDQKNTAPHVPAWVGAEVIQYAQYNFDLAGAMDIVVDSLKAAAKDDADAAQIDGGVAMANGALASQLGGLNLHDLLASFGTTHRALSYLPPEIPAAPEAGMRRINPFASLKMALVWQDANPEVWNKVMEVAGRHLTAQTPFVKADEQGYKGFATKPDTQEMQGGFYLGKNGLVVGLGADAARTCIAGLNANGKQNHLLEDCRPAMPLREAWLHVFGDARPGAKNGLKLLKAAEAESAKNASTDTQKQEHALLVSVIAALPTPEQIDEMFSMTASQGWTDAAGFHAEGSVILAPAKK